MGVIETGGWESKDPPGCLADAISPGRFDVPAGFSETVSALPPESKDAARSRRSRQSQQVASTGHTTTRFPSHGASQSPERREGAETKKETMKRKHGSVTESLYRDPTGERGLNWQQFNDLIGGYPLAPARIVHSVV